MSLKLVAFASLVSSSMVFAVPAPAPGPAPVPKPQLLPPILSPILPLPTPTCDNGPVQCCDALTGVGSLPGLTDLPLGDLASLLPISLGSDSAVAINCQPSALGLACLSGEPYCCKTSVPLPVLGSVGVSCDKAPGIGGIIPGLPGLGGIIL